MWPSANEQLSSFQTGRVSCLYSLDISVGDKLTRHLLWMKREKRCESTVNPTGTKGYKAPGVPLRCAGGWQPWHEHTDTHSAASRHKPGPAAERPGQTWVWGAPHLGVFQGTPGSCCAAESQLLALHLLLSPQRGFEFI